LFRQLLLQIGGANIENPQSSSLFADAPFHLLAPLAGVSAHRSSDRRARDSPTLAACKIVRLRRAMPGGRRSPPPLWLALEGSGDDGPRRFLDLGEVLGTLE
jgi:hypothetical protein